MLAALRERRLHDRVRREARSLVREARIVLRRHGPRVPGDVQGEISSQADRLEKAAASRDHDAIATGLVKLDDQIDRHLAFARKSTFREYFESILVAVFIAVLLRAFVVEAFKIPSGSMIPTMEIGDHIFVNKFIYGVRIPWTRTKLFEVRPPRRGEVVVFMNPCIPDKDYIKRIVAVAGDTVEMRCSVLYVNGVAVKQELVQSTGCSFWDLEEEHSEWKLRTCSRYRETIGETTFEALYNPDRPRDDAARARGRFEAGEHDFPRLMNHPDLDRLRELVPNCNNMPRATEIPPPAGKVVATSDPTMAPTECSPQLHYVVPPGQVFCMGDNRDNSNDSRSWGPVPIENIKGKALFIWWSSSEKSDGPRFERMGQIVH
jgi:signal peptidase I